MHDRQEHLTRQLTHLPDAVLPALARRVADEDDPRVIPLAFAIFAPGLNHGRKLPDEAVQTLKKSKLAAVAEMGNQRL